MDKIYFLAFLLLIFRISTACGASNNALIDKSQNLLNNHPEVRRIQNSKILKIANVRDLFFKNLSAEAGNLKADFFFGIIYGCDGNYEYRGIFIYDSGICIITRNKDDVRVEFFAYDSMSDTQKNIFKKLSALYAKIASYMKITMAIFQDLAQILQSLYLSAKQITIQINLL